MKLAAYSDSATRPVQLAADLLLEQMHFCCASSPLLWKFQEREKLMNSYLDDNLLVQKHNFSAQ